MNSRYECKLKQKCVKAVKVARCDLILYIMKTYVKGPFYEKKMKFLEDLQGGSVEVCVCVCVGVNDIWLMMELVGFLS